MNEINNPASATDLPWLTSDHQMRVPDAPDSAKAAPAAVGPRKNAAQGEHDIIDRLANSAAPAVRQLGESVSAAGEKLHAKSDQLREVRDEWAEGVRSTVRSKPLVSVAAALALGVVIARIIR